MAGKGFSARGAYFTLILILTLVLVTSTSYSMWTDRIRMNFNVDVGKFDYKIGCCKLECEHEGHEASVYCCSKELKVAFSGLNGTMNLWVKTHVENTGTIPLIVTGVNAMATNGSASGLQADAYYYGPYVSHPKCGMKGGNHVMPPQGWSHAPVIVYPGETLVIWVNIHASTVHGDLEVRLDVNVESAAE